MRVVHLKGDLLREEGRTYQKTPCFLRIKIASLIIGGIRVCWPVQEVSE